MKKSRKKIFILITLLVVIFNNIMLGNIAKAAEENTDKITKEGIFGVENVEDKEYLAQAYRVNFKDGATSYNIAISNFPKDTIVTNAEFKEINKLEEDIFNILIPRQNVIEDINGVITVDNQEYKFEKSTKICEATIKLMNKTGETIKNQAIGLMKEGNVIGEGVTNAEGKATFKNLYPGRYSVKVKKENGEYNQETATLFNLIYGDKRTVIGAYEVPKENNGIVIENEKKKGKFEINVVDKGNEDSPMENIEIEILNDKGEVVETLKTNAEGKATSKGLVLHTQYIVRQKTMLENYAIDQGEAEEVLGENGEVKKIIFKNEMKKNVIKITKVDKDDNNIKLSGVVFEILDEQDNLIETITTDKDGIATSSRLEINKTYKIKETKTKSDYVLDETVITVYLTENGTQRSNVEEKETKQLSSVKMDSLIIENKKIYNRLPKFGC